MAASAKAPKSTGRQAGKSGMPKTASGLGMASDDAGKRASLKQQQQDSKPAANGNKPQRNLVDELKLFQNNQLLNQLDPIEQLHRQLSELTDASDFMMQQETAPVLAQSLHTAGDANLLPATDDESGSTVKKGVLWEQQKYDKFHRRLFSRWKKRYFILTTDYLVCFQRSPSRVGRSEMGKFIYKTDLSDVTKTEWLKPAKSDKGPIVVYIRGQSNLLLWCKENLEEWMFMIAECVQRNKIRRLISLQSGVGGFSVPLNGLKGTGVADGHDNMEEKLGAKELSMLLIEKEKELEDDAGALYENTKVVRDDVLNNDEPSASTGAKLNQETDPSLSADDIAAQRQIHKEPASSATERKRPSVESSNASTRIDHDSASSPGNTSSTCTQPRGSLRQQDSLTSSASSSADISSSRKQSKSSAKLIPSKAEVKGRVCGKSKSKSQAEARKLAGFNGSESGASSIEREPAPSIAIKADTAQATTEPEAERAREVPEVDSVHGGRRGGFPIVINEQSCNDKQSEEPISSSTETTNTELAGASVGGTAKSWQQASGAKVARRRRSDSVEESSVATGDSLGGGSSHATATVNSSRGSLARQAKPLPSPPAAACTKGSGNKIETKAHLEERDSKKPAAGELSNSIRRNDSWQSLVSLTRVVPLSPSTTQVAQRSLYAQHIMPDGSGPPQQQQLVGPAGRLLARQQFTRQELINIESTATPSRGPLFRQYSIQSQQLAAQRLRLQQQQQQQHQSLPEQPTNETLLRNSVVVQGRSTPQPIGLHQNGTPLNNQQRQTSYQEKLGQLQLLHNSNNVDYIRHNGGVSDDYQIYSGAPTAASIYGYSSMRSNLKSVASEFSFIRPSLSTHQHHQQLDPQSLHVAPRRGDLVTPSSSVQPSSELELQPTRSLLVVGQELISEQHLVNPVTGERMVNIGSGQTAVLAHELPLKPNKRRNGGETCLDNSKSLPKSFSLGASIACFFRRAFFRGSSKRRKSGGKKSKKGQSQLAESCSSSLAMFDETSYPASAAASSSRLPITSAFSTGNKSMVLVRDNDVDRKQNPRMIDMIEAFASKTAGSSSPLPPVELASQEFARPSGASLASRPLPEIQTRPAASGWQQFGGSPLHKSNSISATMGLSHHESPMLNYRASLLNGSSDRHQHQFLMAPSKPITKNDLQVNETASLVSPAALTPKTGLARYNQFHQAQVAPRSPRLEHLPRPSSIYGQPSMTGSPVISAPNAEERANNFGIHRNSMHGTTSASRGPTSGNFHQHHHNQMQLNMRHLNATCELPEEPSSPVTNEEGFSNASPYQRRTNALSGQQHHKIISHQDSSSIIHQSPTMHAIYDNHPMLNPITTGTTEVSAGGCSPRGESHYDNPQFQTGFTGRSPRSSTSMSQLTMKSQEEPLYYRKVMDTTNNNNNNTKSNSTNNFHTPMHIRLLPSATTNNHNKNELLIRRQVPGNSVSPHINGPRSPVLVNTRHSKHSSSHYQQSPLVSQQTRVEQRPDGVQATTISSLNNCIEPAVVIAGAPGVTLEPSLAASLLRGTNIDAYQCSTLDRSSWNSNPTNNEKTFLISTRLSRTIAKQKHKSLMDTSDTNTAEQETVEDKNGKLGVFDESMEKNWIHSKLVD